MRGIKRMQRILKGKRASTMIETLVAFLVIVIMALMFSKVITVASNLLISTKKNIDGYEQYNKEYYKVDRKRGLNGGLSIRVDMTRTNPLNKATEVELPLSENTIVKYYKMDDSGLTMFSFGVKGTEDND